MLLDYTMPGVLPGKNETVWSQSALQPLAPGSLTPFSYSVLAEIVSRAWYLLNDRLGYEPTPHSYVVRRHEGRAYLNLSISAWLAAEHAGLEPLTFQINNQPYPLASWEKPGFLDGFKVGRAQRKRDELLSALGSQMETVTQKARNWQLKTQELRWSQAEVLQVMEEIDRAGQEAMIAYLAARHGLELLYGRLLATLGDRSDDQQTLLLINGALGGLTGLVETEIAAAVVSLSETVENQPAVLAWLKAGDFQNWQSNAPNRGIGEALAAFLAAYGHRAMSEGELAQPRWSEEPAMLIHSLLACLEFQPKRPAKPAVNGDIHKQLDGLPPQSRKQAAPMLRQLHELHILQSRALHALAYVWAGARRWALAAAKEAMADGRLQAVDEVFFFELEEIKQMMTGEWNISSLAEIRATLSRRRAGYQADQQCHPAPLLIGNQEAYPVRRPAAGVGGQATGPLCRWAVTQKDGCHGAILGTPMLDSGWALGLPLAGGFIAAEGSPLDPFVAAACTWRRPVVVGLGAQYNTLVDGAQTVVDGDGVEVSQ
jgi:pyruvate,water dikinase